MNPYFSIIIPTYNAEGFISRCLDSLECQTFKDFELLILDGKSDDETIKLVRGFKEKFIRLRMFSQKDQGVYDAMNRGVKKAKGTWIYFLGSDDTLIDKHVLFHIAKAIDKQNGLDVLYGNVLSNFYGGIYNGEFLNDDLSRLNICHQSLFFNKDLFKKIGSFNLKYPVLADWDHNIRWFYNNRIRRKYIDLTIANFADGGLSNQHEDSVFLKIKNYKILILGFKTLSFLALRRLCKIELELLKDNSNIFKWVFLKVYLIIIRMRRKYYTLRNSN